MSRLEATFEGLRARGRKALVPFVTAGDPALEATVPVLHALVAAGADVIELGVPFSDPMADGPVIQRSSERALARGAGLTYVFDTADLDGIEVPHQHHRRARIRFAERAHRVEHVRQPGAARERAFRAALDHRAVRHGIGERHAEFEHVRPAGDERMQHRYRRVERGIARGDERHQGLAARTAQRGERGLDPAQALGLPCASRAACSAAISAFSSDSPTSMPRSWPRPSRCSLSIWR